MDPSDYGVHPGTAWINEKRSSMYYVMDYDSNQFTNWLPVIKFDLENGLAGLDNFFTPYFCGLIKTGKLTKA